MRIRNALVAVALGALAAAATGAALATVADDELVFSCVKSSGAVRIVGPTTVCKKSEREVNWNVEGPEGPEGATGPAGPTGPRGPAGPQGPAGAGLSALEDLNGVACHAGGAAGTIALTYDGTRNAQLTCVSGGAAPAVRVNEFMTGMAGAAADEFVELYNAGDAPAHVGGWKIVYRSAAGTSDTTLVTIPSGTTIAAGGFYLAGGSAYSGAAAADQSFATSLAASGGGVGVRDASGALIDSVGYGSATNLFVEDSPATAPGAVAAPGESSGRNPDGNDTNDNSGDFGVTITPTPRATNA